MPEAIENYIPQSVAGKMRKRAIIAWGVFAFLVFLWVLPITLAPIAEANHLTGVSTLIYNFFGYLCHQNPARSMHIYEHAFAVCSRCFGVYFGLFFGFFIYPFTRPIEETEPLPRFWLFLAMIPMAIDWLLGVFEIWENTHWSRFLTGAILGAACAVFIVPAIIEIFQLFPTNKGKKAV
ncbi:MAG TPA: DUF2085 domain-containing protein [Pyrinomonadaceae bacterium]|nr:DUF2085 domain-containing protein [Pyrinomonadaceae bacterium]